MRKLRVVLSLSAMAMGLGGALATSAPGDPIPGNAYLPENCEEAVRTDCDGGTQACTFGPNNTQLYWDVENQFGEPAGTCIVEATYTP